MTARLCIECFRALEDDEDARCLLCEEGDPDLDPWLTWDDFDSDFEEDDAYGSD